VTHASPQSSPYSLKLKERKRINDEASEENIVLLSLVATHGEELPPFIPGQLLRIGLPDGSLEPAYFAIASAPHELDRYELIVKQARGVSAILATAEAGAEFTVEGPMGRGFELPERFDGDLFLIGGGTGVAPLRSVWRALMQDRSRYERVDLYIGYLTPQHLMLAEEMTTLKEHKIDATVVIERADRSWRGRRGFVQEAFKADQIDGSRAYVCLCGLPGLVDEAREALVQLGFDERRILLNF